MKILARLESSKNFWFVIFTSFLFFLLRLPSFFEPLWYGDEGIYQVIGLALRNGRLLYRDIFDNKPPLLYLIYSILNSEQFLVRLASLAFGILSIVVFFFLARKIFGSDNKILFIVTFIFAFLFGLPFLEGNIANAENFMLLPILVAALLMFPVLPGKRNHNSFAAGLLLGIAFLFKIVAVFDLGAFLTFLFFLNLAKIKNLLKNAKNIISEFREIFLLCLGFAIPPALTALFFLAKGAFLDFAKAVLSSNIGYVGYANNLGIPQGFLFIKLILLFIFIVFLFFQRTKLRSAETFVLFWFAFSLFNAFFSGRPYTHYLLVLLPSFSLMFGFLFLKKFIQKMSFILLIASIIVIYNTFTLFGYQKTINYYKNFVLFVAGKQTVSSYRSFFDRRTPIDYEITAFIKSHTNSKDKIFIWGNNAQVYKMVGILPPGKYIVEYHIVQYKDGILNTKQALEKTKPKFVVIMPGSGLIPFPLINYLYKINIDNVSIYERIF